MAANPPTSQLNPAIHALETTRQWIDRFGGRLAGEEACRQTAEALFSELKSICRQAALEPFTTHPAAFTRFYQVDVILYLVGLGLLWLGQPLAAAVILTLIVVGAGLQFGWYVELYDWLYPQKTCYNVTAVLEPRGAARQQLILSGHHDSAQELKFLRRHQKLYALKIIVPDFFRILGMVTAWSWVIWQAAAQALPPFVLPARVLLVVGIYFVFTKFHLFSPEATPGAGDNLIASAMLVELAKGLADSLRPGSSLLEHTRLIFASFDAEESGLRGSRAWVRAHAGELQALPSFALNIDSIYNLKDLQFLTSDLNSHVRLDEALAQRCLQIAAGQGFPAAAAVMRFGGGGTDAAELARAGVRATTMIAMPAGVIRDGLVYHTMRDTVDAIEPQAVTACLAVARQLALDLDQDF